MSLDTSDVRSAIRKIESDMRRLQADVEQLRRVVNATDVPDKQAPNGTPSKIGFALPPEIVIREPSEIVQYLRAHQDLTDVVTEMATAILEAFSGERSEIELVLYQDPEIDGRQLTFYVRVTDYDESLMPRLDAISERFDEPLTHASDLVLITTDYRPMQ